MAWSDNMIPLFRVVSGDMDTPYTYSDPRVIDLLISAAVIVLSELDFAYSYTVDIVKKTIAPAPTSTGEQAFEILVVLKAACIVATSEYRTASLHGMAVRDGPSSIDTRGRVAGLKGFADIQCEKYNRAKLAYSMGDGLTGKVIVGPHLTYESDIGTSSPGR